MMKAVILLSGGLDSTVMLAKAREQGRECYALSFNYGQRNKVELESAKAIAHHYRIPHRIIIIDPVSFDKSSLVTSRAVPKDRTAQAIATGGIPSTYVPARNTLFLAYALGQAEILEAQEIHVGFNALDRLPYPDCRMEFVQAFQALIQVATKQSVEGKVPKLITSLIELDKTQIIRQGQVLNAPLHLTFSCYDPTPDAMPCRRCDACILRQNAFDAVNRKGQGLA